MARLGLMMRWALAALVLLVSGVAGGTDLPVLDRVVVDEAGVLSPADVRSLDDLARGARAARGGTGPQLGFVLVRTLGGEPVESFSMRVAEKWRLGDKGRGNGVLFVVATTDHRVRIEVGQGVEGELPDVEAARIIREVLAPAFRAGRYGPGLVTAATRVVRDLQPAEVAAQPKASADERLEMPSGVDLAIFALWVCVGVFLLWRMFGPSTGWGNKPAPRGRALPAGAPEGFVSGGGVPARVSGESTAQWVATVAADAYEPSRSSSSDDSSSSGSDSGWDGGGGGFSGGGASGSW